MSTETKHTSGKLKVSGQSIITDDDRYCIANIEDDGGYEAPERDGNAARLVLAWNCHDDLLAALEGLNRAYNLGRMPNLEERRASIAAITKATKP